MSLPPPQNCHGALALAGGAGRREEEKVSLANIIKLLKQISSGTQIRKAKIKEHSRTNKKAGNKISSYVIPSLCAAVSTIVQLYCFGKFLCIKLKAKLWRNSSLCCVTLKRIILPIIISTSSAAIEAAICSHSGPHPAPDSILFDLIILELKCGARILNLKWSFFVRNCVSIKEICILPFRKFHFVTSWNEGLFCMSCPLHFTTVTCIQQKWKIFYFLDTFAFYFGPISGICVTYCDGEVEWRGTVNNWYIQINASYPHM